MTRYDPFAYGEVSLDPNQQKEQPPPQDAEDVLFDPGEATKQGPPADANWSLLSEQDDAAPTAAPDASVAMEFGNDILGEEVESDPLYGDVSGGDAYGDDELGAAPEGMAPLSDLMGEQAPVAEAEAFAMPAEPMHGQELVDCDLPGEAPAASEFGAPAAPAAAAAASSGNVREVRRRPLPAPAVKPVAAQKKAARGKPRRRPRGAFAAIVPLALCAGGGTGASWFWVMQHNPVMGGIIGAATLVSALFSWLLLRG